MRRISWIAVVSGGVRIAERSGSTVSESGSGHHARLAVPHQDRNRDPSGSGRRQGSQLQILILTEPLQLVATILEPDLHLLRGELEQLCQLVAFGRRQVALLFEARLQFVDLENETETEPEYKGMVEAEMCQFFDFNRIAPLRWNI